MDARSPAWGPVWRAWRPSRVPAPAPGGEASRWRRLSAWLLGRPAPADALERLRTDLVLAFSLAFLAFGCVVLFAIHFVVPLPDESQALARFTTPVFMCGLLASVGLLRRTGSVRFSAQVNCATVFVAVGLSTVYHGGLHSPVLVIWVMLPIVAGLLAGRHSAVFWSAALIVFLLGLDQAESAGWFASTPVSEAAYLPSLIANMAIACASAAAAVFLYESINAGLRSSLEAERSKLRYEAGHDPLTDLPNRRLFDHLQDQALRRADRTGHRVGLFVVDLDRFKPVNDEFGHAAGDEVLRAIARQLREFTRVTDSIARLGGDEFAVLFELLGSEDDAHVLADRLSEALSLRVELGGGRRVETSASIGIALYPDAGADAEGLHAAADSAMYEAKMRGGDCYVFSGDPS